MMARGEKEKLHVQRYCLFCLVPFGYLAFSEVLSFATVLYLRGCAQGCLAVIRDMGDARLWIFLENPQKILIPFDLF